MKYLLDTNIISELYKPQPHPLVVSWIAAQSPNALYLSAITIGEARKGIEKRRMGNDGANITKDAGKLAHMESVYGDKIWNFDRAAAHFWGQIIARVPNHDIDAQIAGIALANTAAVVTRNVKDFSLFSEALAPLGIRLIVINPFEVMR